MTPSGRFPLFQTPIDLAHAYWTMLLKPGDRAIDATCGNGYDSLFIASLIFSEEQNGHLWVMDTQERAIEATRKRINHIKGDITYCLQCHSTFPSGIAPASLSLIVYNLGYLPGHDKRITTLAASTLESVKNALLLVKQGGVISITCYPGHEEGSQEEEALTMFCAELNPREWSCCKHTWLNRRASPSLILFQRSYQNSLIA